LHYIPNPLTNYLSNSLQTNNLHHLKTATSHSRLFFQSPPCLPLSVYLPHTQPPLVQLSLHFPEYQPPF